MKPPRAIFFDFGDTLVKTEPTYVERLRITFEDEGVPVSEADMERAYLEADWRSAAALVGRMPFPVEGWRELFMAIILETLNIRKDACDFLQRVSKRMAAISPSRMLIQGVEEFLNACSKCGIKMGILSNNDGRTKKKAEEAGITGYFDLIMDSTMEGMSKPDPKFFQEALIRLNMQPNECLHIGDLLGCDVIGAQAARIPVAWLHQRKYLPISNVRPEIVIGGFPELGKILGLYK